MADSKFYTVSWASDPSGDPDQHGNRWQNLKLEGYDGYTVRILAKNPINKGQQMYGHVEKAEKRSKPGEFYYRFRRQQVPEGVQRPATGVTSGGTTQLDRIEQKVDAIAKMVGVQETSETEQESIERQGKEVAEQLPSDDEVDNIDLSDIPF